MYNFIYSRPLWLVVFLMLLLAVLWSRWDELAAADKSRRWKWKLLNLAVLPVSLLFIAEVTLLRREPMAESVVILQPFATLARIAEQPEYIRTMLMNAALFMPLGLGVAGLFPHRWPAAVKIVPALLIGAAVSCGVEQLQYLHLLGTAEVDDVICNTLGALMGAQFVLIAPIRRRFFKNLSW